MTYYPTLDEDLQRAKEILDRGRELPTGGFESRSVERRLAVSSAGGHIYGGDTYAAYKLLESFVTEIWRLRADVALARRAPCKDFHPDHNGECLNCDEWADAHCPPECACRCHAREEHT